MHASAVVARFPRTKTSHVTGRDTRIHSGTKFAAFDPRRSFVRASTIFDWVTMRIVISNTYAFLDHLLDDGRLESRVVQFVGQLEGLRVES